LEVVVAKMEALIDVLWQLGMIPEEKDREQATEWFLNMHKDRNWVDTDIMVNEYCALFKGASSSAPPPSVLRGAGLGLIPRPNVVDDQAAEEGATTTSAAAEAPEAAAEVAEGDEETDPVDKAPPVMEEKEKEKEKTEKKEEKETAAGGRVSIMLVSPRKLTTKEMGANAAGKSPVSHSPPHDTKRSPTVVKKEKKDEVSLVPVSKRPKRETDKARK
jgi:hypothetical protein